MDEFSRRLPDWVWLTEIVYDAKGISIKGRALSNNLVADYISNLESSPQIMNVNLVASTQKTVQGDQYLEFSLRATVEKKPEPVPAAAPPEPDAKPAAKKKGGRP
jgi:Tfp pilus assembly protein PilN